MLKYSIRLILSLLFVIAILCQSACSKEDNQSCQSEKDSIATASAINDLIGTPEFFNDMDKTLSGLRKEHPNAVILTQPGGLPGAAAACFGESEGNYAYYFFGTHDGDIEYTMNKCGDRLKCAGFITTADVLFPGMEADMPFSDFFTLIGVSDYEYDTDDDTGQGWLFFKYNNMDVMINTNEINSSGGWEYTGIEKVKRNAPVSIIDDQLEKQNYEGTKEYSYVYKPDFFYDLWEDLYTLRMEHPKAEIFVRNDGLPSAAAICLGEPAADYAYYFFEAQDDNAEAAMDEYGDKLICAGFLTTADVLFPEMEEDMPFADFFTLIGVSDYNYYTDVCDEQGWIGFQYSNMYVLLNTNVKDSVGGWNFTGIERIKKSAPVVVYDKEIAHQNYVLAQSANSVNQSDNSATVSNEKDVTSFINFVSGSWIRPYDSGMQNNSRIISFSKVDDSHLNCYDDASLDTGNIENAKITKIVSMENTYYFEIRYFGGNTNDENGNMLVYDMLARYAITIVDDDTITIKATNQAYRSDGANYYVGGTIFTYQRQ